MNNIKILLYKATELKKLDNIRVYYEKILWRAAKLCLDDNG